MGNQASSKNWQVTVGAIKEYYVKAFTDIEKGITCEENEKPHEVITEVHFWIICLFINVYI